MLEALHTGLGAVDVALFLDRLFLGVFFAIAGYHKLFNVQRHAQLESAFHKLNIPAVKFNVWFVPLVEFFGGLALIAGILAPLASLGLIVICLVACFTDGRKRLIDKHPLDKADRLNEWLYMPEVIYIVGLKLIVLCGAGSYTLPAYVLG